MNPVGTIGAVDMCLICKLWQLEKITTKEAKKACWELVNDPEVDDLHLQELYEKLEAQEREDCNEQVD